MTPNKILVKFIKEARRRGYDDYQIREPMLKKGWPVEQVEQAFSFLKPKEDYTSKNKVTIYLKSDILKKLEKRATKNCFTLPEQIEDILRRSVLTKGSDFQEKLDDKFISFFSRKKK